MTSLGCATPEAVLLGCRPGDKMDAALIADSTAPAMFKAAETGTERPARPQDDAQHVTAWWDTSQIYGYDERSERRVKRDPADRAKFDMRPSRPVRTRVFAGVRERVPARGDDRTMRPDPARMGRPGSHGLSRQLVDRHELLSQSVRARAQQLRG